MDMQWPRPFEIYLDFDPSINSGRRVQFIPDLFYGPGGERPNIIYSDNYAESERVAQALLSNTVVGFQ
jgi:hypothetical protein